jgi:hypothetical protein
MGIMNKTNVKDVTSGGFFCTPPDKLECIRDYLMSVLEENGEYMESGRHLIVTSIRGVDSEYFNENVNGE